MIDPVSYALGAHRSQIRELFEYGCERAKIVGRENVFDYSLGNPSIPSPPEIHDAVRAILADTDPLSVHGYTSSVGDYDTRKAISDELNARYAITTEPGDFFLGCGAAPELTAVMRALSVENGEILAIAPYFPEYKPFAECSGLRFRVVSPDVPDFQIRPDAVEAMICEHTQAVIINSPNNPSGVVYTAETLHALAALLRKKSEVYAHPIYLISDEPYRELAYGVNVPWVPSIYENTIVCYSYSKSLSLPGERIGYTYVPREADDSRALLAAIAGAARAVGHVCAPSLWQKVIARCAHVRPDLAAYDRNRRTLYEALTQMGYETAKPDGAFYLFIKAPGGDANAFSELAKKHDLLIVPGNSFGCPGYFRICYCVDYEMIVRSLPVFRALMDSVSSSSSLSF